MGRVAGALLLHELWERARDKWVIVVCLLFAALTSAVVLYGKNAGDNAAGLTGPSLVTLASLFVPLVALVLSHDAVVGERERNTLGLLLSLPISRFEVVLAKFLGRGIALVVAVGLGIGISAAFGGETARVVLPKMIWPTLVFGLAFLSLGMLVSSIVKRQVTAASMVVVIWFVLVFFFDLGLLGLLVATDGAISQQTISWLVTLNPSGLYRLEMMNRFSGPEVLSKLGLATALPAASTSWAIWLGWILAPVGLSGFLLFRKKVL